MWLCNTKYVLPLCPTPLPSNDASKHPRKAQTSLQDCHPEGAGPPVAGIGHVCKAASQDGVEITWEATKQSAQQEVGHRQLQIHHH